MSDPAVEAQGIYHIYRSGGIESVALKGASLSLATNTWTSIMGPSGSGKSTLVDVLAGFVEPSAGAVLVAGQDITRLPARERTVTRRHTIGLVRQRGNLHPTLRVAENVSLPLRLDGRPRAEVRRRTDEMLAAVGLADRGRQQVATLSGGESQRVAIAAALVQEPVVVIADEPTGELDEHTTEDVLELLERLRRDLGTSILTVTHNPVVASRASQRLEMRDGVLLAAS